VLDELNPWPKSKGKTANCVRGSKRRYRLSAAGKEALRAAILKAKPWERSTGPRSLVGKMAMRQNAIKHGYYSRMPLAEAAAFKAFVKSLNRKSGGVGRHPDPGLPVW
jgi:hypothetical protein